MGITWPDGNVWSFAKAPEPGAAPTCGGSGGARGGHGGGGGGGSTRVYAFAMVLVAVAVAARCFPRTLDAAMVVATDTLLAARGWAEINFPRTMQAIAERLGGASYEGVARESEAPGAGRGREDSV